MIYPLPYMLKHVLVLLHLQLPSNTLLCAVNENTLLVSFCFWIVGFQELGVGFWGF